MLRVVRRLAKSPRCGAALSFLLLVRRRLQPILPRIAEDLANRRTTRNMGANVVHPAVIPYGFLHERRFSAPALARRDARGGVGPGKPADRQ